MSHLKKPHLPKYNLYEFLLERNHDHNVQAVLRAVEGTFLKFQIPKSDWSAMGNMVLRFGLVVLENGDFAIDETDGRLLVLKRLSVEMFTRLGESPPFLKIHWDE